LRLQANISSGMRVPSLRDDSSHGATVWCQLSSVETAKDLSQDILRIMG